MNSRGASWGWAIATAIPLWLGLFRDRQQDVAHYVEFVEHLRALEIPGRDFSFEYPPLAWLAFLPALLGATAKTAGWCISAGLAVVDLLLRQRLARTARPLVSLGAFSVFTWACGYWYLRRFDVVPAWLLVLALTASANPLRRGALLMTSGLMKLFPFLLGPMVLTRATAADRPRVFLGGLLVLVPLIALTPWWPWYRFALFHEARGLQVESTAASLLWLLREPLQLSLEWVKATASHELHGPAADLARLATLGLWGLFTGLSVIWSTQRELTPRTALVPLLALVVFSPVFSPQYLVWLMPLAALTLAERPRDPGPWLIVLAGLLVPLVYPSDEYDGGLLTWRAATLVTRNLLLVGAWVLLLRPGTATRPPQTA